MATMLERTAVKDLYHPDAKNCEGNLLLKKGRKYNTLRKPRNGEVRVCSTYWFWAKEEYFEVHKEHKEAE